MKRSASYNRTLLANITRIGFVLILIFVLSLGMFTGCGKKAAGDEGSGETGTAAVTTTTSYSEAETDDGGESDRDGQELPKVDEDGVYDSKEEVAAYIVAFGKLPPNYITKDEARKLGWSGGSVEKYAPGKCIGGDSFGNYEGKLPAGKYIECDIDTLDYRDRGSRRLIFSDKEIYYTHDHYRHFEKVCDR